MIQLEAEKTDLTTQLHKAQSQMAANGLEEGRQSERRKRVEEKGAGGKKRRGGRRREGRQEGSTGEVNRLEAEKASSLTIQLYEAQSQGAASGVRVGVLVCVCVPPLVFSRFLFTPLSP